MLLYQTIFFAKEILLYLCIIEISSKTKTFNFSLPIFKTDEKSENISSFSNTYILIFIALLIIVK